jgi:hypothetical protein
MSVTRNGEMSTNVLEGNLRKTNVRRGILRKMNAHPRRGAQAVTKKKDILPRMSAISFRMTHACQGHRIWVNNGRDS